MIETRTSDHAIAGGPALASEFCTFAELIAAIDSFLPSKAGEGWTQVLVCFWLSRPWLCPWQATAAALVVTRPPTQEH